jgi:beta-glucosidase/6-phospho-beta-glucosidase/beta-galactosidase/lysophospholipase L1-like esterase
MPITIHPTDVTISTDPQSLERARQRLLFHKAILASLGVTDLSSLGKLGLSGNVVPQPGLTVGSPDPFAHLTTFQSALRPVGVTNGNVSMVPVGGQARVLRVIDASAAARSPLRLAGIGTSVSALTAAPAPTVTGAIPIDTAYWAASWIDLADDTTIVFKQPQHYLTLICERLTVGSNVAFTWEPPMPPQPPALTKPAKPAQAPTPDGLWGVTGANGTDGVPGGKGADGANGPELEVWVLELHGSPLFDLRGQDGWTGGQGQDGGDGGDGSKGRIELYDWLGFCKSGPGNGGDGGPGGRAGGGGSGGNGGHGGRLALNAPQTVLEQYTRSFFVSVDGGAPGAGGIPGVPGAGGAGGQVGDSPKNCAPSTPRLAGAPGGQGAGGARGGSGQRGGVFPDGISFVPISADEFRRELTKPAITNLVPNRAKEGDRITVQGLRFSTDDTLLVENAAVPATILSDTAMTFELAAVPGGQRAVQVQQVDGTQSNRATLYVLPVISRAEPSGRVRPGATVTLIGSGFAPGSLVRANGQDMPDVKYLDSERISFTLTRPAAVAPAAAGETVTVQVVLPDGVASPGFTLVLDTFRMVVVGDSVAWGQGLQEHEKYDTLVESALAAKQANIGVYKTMLAHSGATIGVGDATTLPAIDGEVPTSYPTIAQQVDAFTDAPETVDLVLVNGGLNDVNVRTVLNPLTKPSDLVALIDERCRNDMTTLLSAIAQKFENATIVVTGYYPMVTAASDTGLLEPLLIAAGIAVLSLPGGFIATQAKPTIVKNCHILYDETTAKLTAAVDAVNDDLPSPRIIFANPSFADANAALAPEAWLFGINGDLTPQDNVVAGPRALVCVANASRTDVEVCKRASIGHPNPSGAQKFAEAILAAIERGAGRDEMSDLPPFPNNFLWGAATAGYQVEGAIENNDWNIFTTSPAIKRRVAKLTGFALGRQVDLAPPGPAVKHGDLNVLRRDLDRAQALGLNAYRFSLEWSRIQPTKPTNTPPKPTDFNATALTYYGTVIDECQKRGLEPIVTLNHMTLPEWVLTPPRESSILSAIGLPTAVEDDLFKASLRGWESDATVRAFVQYVAFVVGRFKDKVRYWLTMNEPVGSMIGVGYVGGIWPPGFSLDGARAKQAYLNLIKAHARAYNRIKAIDPDSQVGFAHAMLFPKTSITAAAVPQHVQEAARNQFAYFYNWHFLEAVVNGKVDVNIHRRPANQKILGGQELSTFFGFPIDSTHPWRKRLDFVGVNYYRGVYVYYDQVVATLADFTGGAFQNDLHGKDEPHGLLNELGWEIYPAGLGVLLRQLQQRYSLPIIITENGIPESVDHNRAPFIVAHLQQVLSAIKDGVDVRGYIHWSLVDNYEWHEGYRPQSHFGLFSVDRSSPALPRHITTGALALRSVIADGGVNAAAEEFGTITTRGDRVRPPRRFMGAVLEGSLEADKGISIFLERLPSSGLTGMAFFHDAKVWRRLENVAWDESQKKLTFAHTAGAGVPSRHYEAIASNGGLSGTYAEGTSAKNWHASRVIPCGLWIGDTWLKRVQLVKSEGAFTGWAGTHLEPTPSEWQLLPNVSWDGTTLTIDDGTSVFTGSVQGDAVTGTVATPSTGTSLPWRARRVPDGVPI